MSFIQFFRILWARRAIILIATLGCFLAAFGIAKTVPPRYEAQSRVMLDIVKPDPVTGEVIASQFARAYTKTQIELIRDYRIAGKVVDAFGWTESPQLLAQYQARRSDDNRDFRRWLAQIVINSTDAKLIEGSNILEITYSASSPETARRVADALRQAYIDQTLSFRREDAGRNASWFRSQTDRLRAELTAAEKRKSDFERANGVVLQADNSDTETARLGALAASAPAAPVSVAAAAPVSAPSSAALTQVDAQIATLSRELGPNHPDLQSLQRQRGALAAAVSRETAAARASQRTATTGPSIASQYSAQQARVLAQRGKVNEAQRLASDVAVLRDQYTKTAARTAELQQQAESVETGLTLLGSAVAPQSAAFPKMPLVIFGSLALGLGLGVLIALLVELLGRRVRGAEDLASAGVPVIGVMARGAAPARRRTALEWLGIRRVSPGAA